MEKATFILVLVLLDVSRDREITYIGWSKKNFPNFGILYLGQFNTDRSKNWHQSRQRSLTCCVKIWKQSGKKSTFHGHLYSVIAPIKISETLKLSVLFSWFISRKIDITLDLIARFVQMIPRCDGKTPY